MQYVVQGCAFGSAKPGLHGCLHATYMGMHATIVEDILDLCVYEHAYQPLGSV